MRTESQIMQDTVNRLQAELAETRERLAASEAERARLEALLAAERQAQAFAGQKAFAESIIQNVPTGIAYLDRSLTYRVSNPIYSAFLELPPEQIIGRYLFDVVPGGEGQIQALLEGVLETGVPVYAKEFPFTFYTPDGTRRETFWDFVYYPAVLGPGPEVSGVLVLADEVSTRVERERAQARLLAERERWQLEKIEALEEGDRLKDEFLSILSHELRTPINAIMGFGSALDDELAGPLNRDQRVMTGKILASADALLALIDDLLVVSRVQAGRFSVSPEPSNFVDLVARAIDVVAPSAVKKGLVILNALPDTLPPIPADPQRLGQVITNLLTNAIKFTPAGGTIQVTARLVGHRLRCAVTDTGVGVAEDDVPRLFKRFGQLDTSNTRNAQGTGLGLSIVKAIIEAHGGEVGVDSTPNQGSTFWFTLPCL